MPRTTIQQNGRVVYRTALFCSLPKAQAFARCLSANSDRFEAVAVHASATSKTPKWFVTFEPKADARKDAIYFDQQADRAERAMNEEFIFWSDPDRPALYWCFSVASGETYEVTLSDCSCPDHQFRCAPAGLLCKHRIAWSVQRAAGAIGKTDKRTIGREEMARRIAEDF